MDPSFRAKSLQEAPSVWDVTAHLATDLFSLLFSLCPPGNEAAPGMVTVCRMFLPRPAAPCSPEGLPLGCSQVGLSGLGSTVDGPDQGGRRVMGTSGSQVGSFWALEVRVQLGVEQSSS